MTSETTTAATPGSGRIGLGHGDAGRGVAIARLVIGLIQGVVLWSLVRADETNAWPSTVPELFGPVCLVAILVPVVLLAGVGRLRIQTLVVWGVVAALLTALLAFHDVHRASRLSAGLFGGAIFLPFTAATLFILHHLIVPADRERRWIAPYHAYFDTAWMAGVQLALSVGFIGAFWLLLGLGAALFHVIGVSALGDTITKAWFALPVTGLVFATAVQLSDVRPGLIRGVRTIALMLLSWLLLLLTVLVGAFLAALPFTGLEGLWRTGSATALVLATAGAVVILINAAYQDGQADNLPPLALRIAVRVAAVLLYPLIAIAFWGLSLRIGQHGLTPDRIIALACAVVGLAYAVGYGLAALVPLFRRGSPWMKALEPTNIVVAVLAVGVILALFTPLADPARLSVADQVRRLDADKVSAEAFDYEFLKFHSGKAGGAALERLKASTDPEIARRARQIQQQSAPIQLPVPERDDKVPVIASWPGGSTLPAGFIVAVPMSDPRHACAPEAGCLATTMDMNADGVSEILLASAFNIELYSAAPSGGWVSQGSYRPLNCFREPSVEYPRNAMRSGLLRPAPAQWQDLSFGETPAQIADTYRCRREATPR
jgi:hypothetical protein